MKLPKTSDLFRSFWSKFWPHFGHRETFCLLSSVDGDGMDLLAVEFEVQREVELSPQFLIDFKVVERCVKKKYYKNYAKIENLLICKEITWFFILIDTYRVDPYL